MSEYKRRGLLPNRAGQQAMKEAKLSERITELEQQLARLKSRGFENLHFENEQLKERLRLADERNAKLEELLLDACAVLRVNGLGSRAEVIEGRMKESHSDDQ